MTLKTAWEKAIAFLREFFTLASLQERQLKAVRISFGIALLETLLLGIWMALERTIVLEMVAIGPIAFLAILLILVRSSEWPFRERRRLWTKVPWEKRGKNFFLPLLPAIVLLVIVTSSVKSLVRMVAWALFGASWSEGILISMVAHSLSMSVMDIYLILFAMKKETELLGVVMEK